MCDHHEAWRAQTTEIRQLDSERVLALVNLSGRNRASGLELAQIGSTKGANLLHVLDGKVTKFVLYLDRDHALADLGLAPERHATELTRPACAKPK